MHGLTSYFTFINIIWCKYERKQQIYTNTNLASMPILLILCVCEKLKSHCSTWQLTCVEPAVRIYRLSCRFIVVEVPLHVLRTEATDLTSWFGPNMAPVCISTTLTCVMGFATPAEPSFQPSAGDVVIPGDVSVIP